MKSRNEIWNERAWEWTLPLPGLTRLGPIDWSLVWMLLTLWICSHSPLTRNHSECKRDTRVTQRRGRSQIRAEEWSLVTSWRIKPSVGQRKEKLLRFSPLGAGWAVGTWLTSLKKTLAERVWRMTKMIHHNGVKLRDTQTRVKTKHRESKHRASMRWWWWHREYQDTLQSYLAVLLTCDMRHSWPRAQLCVMTRGVAAWLVAADSSCWMPWLSGSCWAPAGRSQDSSRHSSWSVPGSLAWPHPRGQLEIWATLGHEETQPVTRETGQRKGEKKSFVPVEQHKKLDDESNSWRVLASCPH